MINPFTKQAFSFYSFIKVISINLIKLYYQTAEKAGYDISKIYVASHSYGFVGDTLDENAEKFFPSTQDRMDSLHLVGQSN